MLNTWKNEKQNGTGNDKIVVQRQSYDNFAIPCAILLLLFSNCMTVFQQNSSHSVSTIWSTRYWVFLILKVPGPFGNEKTTSSSEAFRWIRRNGMFLSFGNTIRPFDNMEKQTQTGTANDNRVLKPDPYDYFGNPCAISFFSFSGNRIVTPKQNSHSVSTNSSRVFL